MKILASLFFLCIALSMNAQLDIQQVNDSAYVYTTYQNFGGSPFPSNSMYVLTSEGILMIDTPWDTTQLTPLLEHMQETHGILPVMSISTHFHNDRTGCVNRMGKLGIKTFASVQTQELCVKYGEQCPEYPMEVNQQHQIGDVGFEVIYLGGGHAPDNLLIWFPRWNLLYGGCFVKSFEAQSLGYIGDADINNWLKAAKKIRRKYKKAKTVITGHEAWNDLDSVDRTIELLKAHIRKSKH